MLEKLRKFGFDHYDLPTMLWNFAVLLRPLALNVTNRYHKSIGILSYIWMMIIISTYMYVWTYSMIWFVFWKCPQTGDIVPALCVFPLILTSKIGGLKLFYLFWYKKTVLDITDGYLAIDDQIVPDGRFAMKVAEVMRQVKKRVILYWMMVFNNGVIYVFLPILTSLITAKRNFMDGLYTIYGLEPINESPNYEIGYLLMAPSTFFIVYPTATVVGFHMTLVGYSEAQMTALADEVTDLWRNAEEEYYQTKTHNISKRDDHGNTIGEVNIDVYSTRNINKIVKQKLRRVAILHAENVRLLQMLEQLVRTAVIIQFVFLVIGMISYLLGGLENNIVAIPFSFIQVVVDCSVGQKLMNASILFENAVYDCKWENFDVSNMKIVLLILQNSQKSMTLTAGGIATLNFSCLMTVLKMTYSAYTALLSTIH